MSNNLNIDQVLENQENKETTINTMVGQLDAAFTEVLSLDFSSTDITLTQTQMTRNVAYTAANLTVPRILTLFASARFFFVSNENGTATLTVTMGSATQVMVPGQVTLFYTNGTVNDLSVVTNNTDNNIAYWKEPVVAASTSAGVLADDFENGDTLDSVVLATGDRILLQNQADASENGIRVVAASGTPARSADFDEDVDVVPGISVVVNTGSVNAGKVFVLITVGPIVIDTTDLVFSSLSGGAVEESNVYINAIFPEIGATSAVAAAAKGLILKPYKDIEVSGVFGVIDTVNTGTYKGVIATITGGDIDTIIGETAVFTETATTTAKMQEMIFASNLTLSAGTEYLVLIVRTDIAVNASNGVYVAGNGIYNGLPMANEYTAVSMNVAVANGNTYTTPGGNSYMVGIVGKQTAWSEGFNLPYDVGAFIGGVATLSSELMQFLLPRTALLATDAGDSVAYSSANCSAETDFDIQKNEVSIGTMRFLNGTAIATFVGVSETTFSAGDRLSLHSPSNLNGLVDLSWTFTLLRSN